MDIGTIQLAGFEIPNCIRFGGSQKMAIHRLADGTRSVELLGADESDIWFRGAFSGPDAELRVRSFDTLRTAGSTVTLTWQSFQYDVIVRTFLASYVNPWWIAYTIGLFVVRRQTIPSPRVETTTSLQADISAALALLPNIPIDRSVLLNSALLRDSTVTGSEAGNQVGAALTGAISVVDSDISQAANSLGSAPGLASDNQNAAATLAAQQEAAGLLAANLAVRALLARALSTLTMGATA
jgi:hypothetical protein